MAANVRSRGTQVEPLALDYDISTPARPLTAATCPADSTSPEERVQLTFRMCARDIADFLSEATGAPWPAAGAEWHVCPIVPSLCSSFIV